MPAFLGSVVKPDARADAVHKSGVISRGAICRFYRVRVIDETALAVRAGRQTEAAPKSSAERLVALKAASQRHFQNRLTASQKHGGGAAQTKPQSEMLGRLTGDGGEHAMQMKRRNTGSNGQRSQRKIGIGVLRNELQRGLNLFETSGHGQTPYRLRFSLVEAL